MGCKLSADQIAAMFSEAPCQAIQRMGMIEYIEDQKFGDDDRLYPAFNFASIRGDAFRFI